MQTVAIDCRFASYHAGLGRYTRELTGALLARDDPWEYVLLVKDEGESWIKQLPGAPRLLAAPFPHYSFAEQWKMPGVIRASGAQLLFSPHFNVPLRSPIPFVMTIHDLILHRFPNKASLLKQVAYRTLMDGAIGRAKAVLTVSTFVADELRSVYGTTATEKMHVTFEGVNPHFSARSEAEIAAVKMQYGLSAPYFLYVGNAKEHKNVPMLLQAFAAAKLVGKELILLCGGEEAKSLMLPAGCRLLSGISDDNLPALYCGAIAFVTASLYEGFCLPAAEALACGCPVIAAERGPLREVTGGHARLIEPTVEAFVDAFTNPPSDRTVHLLWDWTEAARRTAVVINGALHPNVESLHT